MRIEGFLAMWSVCIDEEERQSTYKAALRLHFLLNKTLHHAFWM